MDEPQLIEKIASTFPAKGKNPFGLPLDDDAALITAKKGCHLVLTCDWLLEGSHFLRDRHPADSVGWKCLARAASDAAAMGGAPRWFLLSLALPGSHTGRWLGEFLGGLKRAAEAFGCKLAGGDTTCRDEILISVTVIGEIARGRAVRRSGANPGDLLFVTGTLGEAELGWRLLHGHRGAVPGKNAAVRKHLYPEPRLAIGQWLAKKKLASAMMDLSDGLSSDLQRLCAASGVGARITAERLPMTLRVPSKEALPLALHGGDDYELLIAVPGKFADKIPDVYRGVRLTCVGVVTAARKVFLEESGKVRELVRGGWDPFRAERTSGRKIR